MPPPDCGACGKIEPERMVRIIAATLANIAAWEVRLAELEQLAPSGSKHLILALMRDMEFSRRSLKRLAGLGGDGDAGTG